jgi:ABC-type lipoprotein export system ATPase subunit
LKLDSLELSVLRRDEIGFIFQQFNLLPRMSAKENVELPLLYSKKDIKIQIRHYSLNLYPV